MYFNWEWVIVVDPTAYKIPQLRTPSTQPGADYLEEPHFPAAVVRLATQEWDSNGQFLVFDHLKLGF